MDKFDKLIKEAVEGYEAPYDAQIWANVSSQLGSKGGAMKWIIGSAAAVVLISGTVYLMQQNETIPAAEVTAENTVAGENTADNNTLITDQAQNTAEDNSTEIQPAGNENVPFLTISEPGRPGMLGESGNENFNHESTQNGSEPTNGNNTGTDPVNQVAENPGQTPNNAETVSTARINARFNTENSVACMTSEFIFTPEDINQAVVYVWDFGDGSFSSSKVGTHTYKRSGNFTVSLSLKDSKTNKTLSKSSIDITVNPLPEVEFAFEKTNEMIPTVTFINLTENAVEWNWDIKGLKTSAENQFEYTFRKKGIYTVELSATNEFGCTNSTQKPIEVKSDYNLLAPTAFTPNGDNKNDYFIPEALRLMDVTFTMVVYDKVGTVMYQTNNVNQPWDGTNMNDNSLADDGAYVWQVQFKNANGETEYFEGQVIITR
ncbi:MAG: gliding motility-associated C-terminal domain-containing protein [Bacteroidetes bacterium]|nr:gliding motility-associated C-terminal domain-containing protein [Bacteroidota bacterium]